MGWSGSQLQNKESKGYDSFGNKSWIIKNSEILSWLKFVKGVKLERLVAWLNATRKGYQKEYVGVRCVEGLGKRGLSLSVKLMIGLDPVTAAESASSVCRAQVLKKR